MKKVSARLTSLAAFCMVSLLVMGATLVSAAPSTFNDAAFATTWNRVDKAVEEVPGSGRSYLWGPAVIAASTTVTETYNSTDRKVQYFDKARMEVNNPSGDPTNLFYVTTGLLVRELVTGNRQDGDSTFTQLTPSTIQVAGDPNDNGNNAITPTYASFRKVGTFLGDENGVASAINTTINSRIDNVGTVTVFTPPETHSLTAYDSVTKHNVADVFVDFSNQTGQIWNGSNYGQGQVFFGNPTYVLGRPITEPYWTQAVVAGQTQNVLVQLFERRVLTYTPANPAQFKVEMGNVGQHYYKWRYINQNSNPTPIPTSAPQNELQVAPVVDFAGQPFQMSGAGFGSNETVNLWETSPQGDVHSLLSIRSDSTGKIGFTYKSHGPLAGRWAVTAYGLTSKVSQIGYLTLVDFVPGGSASIDLGPYHGDLNSVIEVHGYNFVPNEPYYYQWIEPDGVIQPGHRQDALHHGQFRFHTSIGTDKPGKWTLTVTGLFSGRQASAVFTYDGK